MRTINILFPSYASLFLSISCNGKQIGSATGFLVSTSKGPYLLTNRHVVTGRDNFTGVCLDKDALIPTDIHIWHNKKGTLGTWVVRTEKLQVDGNDRWVEHPILKERADFVALPLTELDDVDLHPYNLEEANVDLVLKPTDILRVVGFPVGKTSSGHGFLAIWATGFIASEPEVDYQALPVFLIDCRARQGQSGSPVIFYATAGSSYRDGDQTKILTSGSVTQFVGIYSGRIHKDSDIGMVWKKAAILELVRSIT